jgi:cytochrome P450 family 4 subfamily B polypeptide 1
VNRIKNRLKKLREYALDVLQSRDASRKDLVDSLLKVDKKTGRQLTQEECLIEMSQFIASGHETSGHTMGWTLMFLASHPEKTGKLRSELLSVMGEDRAVPTVADVQKLPYLTAVLMESSRIRPVTAVGPFRQLDREVKVPGTPHKIPVDTLVNTTFYAIQMDEKNFKNPEAVEPERFLHQDGELIKPFHPAWLPFSAGPRECIGESLAMLEMSMVIGALVLRYDLKLQNPVEPQLNFTWKPKAGVNVTLKRL